MRRTFIISLALFLSLVALARAGDAPCCKGKGVRCIEPPPAPCPECDSPCDKGRHCPEWKSACARKLVDQLHADCCGDRVKAARKLGCRLLADHCCDPEVLEALIGALQCDPCWEVRRQAAWSIMLQKARTGQAVLALHVASKLDPHFLVRDRAGEALGILTVCRQKCFADVLKAGDELVKQLRKSKYRPGSENCRALFAEACAGCEPGPGRGPSTPAGSPDR